MDSSPSHVVKAAKHEPRDPRHRLYREIGVSAVAAALDLASGPIETHDGAPAIEPEPEVRAA
jgi:hypothetical protein